MKTLTEYLIFHTETHRAYVHITPQVEEIVRKSGVKEGMVWFRPCTSQRVST